MEQQRKEGKEEGRNEVQEERRKEGKVEGQKRIGRKRKKHEMTHKIIKKDREENE